MLQRKICMLGAFAVGKSSLVRRYVDNMYSDVYSTTIGVRIDKKVVSIADQEMSLVLWDIHGEDSYQSVLPAYIRGMAGYLLVIDPTRPYTVDNAAVLKNLIDTELGPKPFVLVINKCDLKDEWKITKEDLPSWTSEALLIQEASAKSDIEVNSIFQVLAESLLPSKKGKSA